MSAIAARQRARRQRLLEGIARHALLIGVGLVFVSPFVFVIFTALMTRDQALTRAIWPRSVPLRQLRRRARQPAAAALDLEHVPGRVHLLARRRAELRAAGLRALAHALPRSQPRLPARALDHDAAGPGHDHPALRALLAPRLDRLAEAADRAELLRRRLLDLPAAAVLPDHPGTRSPTPRAWTGRASCGCSCAWSCRWPSPRWSRSSCSTSSTAGTTSSHRCSTSARTPTPTPSRSGLSEFRSSRHVDYELMMAACVLFTLPVTALFFARPARVRGGRDRHRRQGLSSALCWPRVRQHHAALRGAVGGVDGRPRGRLAVDRPRHRHRVPVGAGARALPPGRSDRRGRSRQARPGLRARAGRQGAGRVRPHRAQPRPQPAARRRQHGLLQRPERALRERGRPPRRRHVRRLPPPRAPDAHDRRARHRRLSDLRGGRPADRLAPPADAAVPLHRQRQAARHRAVQPGRRRRLDRDGRARVRPRGARARAAHVRHRQRQLAAALRRAHDRLAHAAGRGEPDRRRDAVHPHGRDGPGLDPGRARAADRRAARGHLPRPARAPGRAGA